MFNQNNTLTKQIEAEKQAKKQAFQEWLANGGDGNKFSVMEVPRPLKIDTVSSTGTGTGTGKGTTSNTGTKLDQAQLDALMAQLSGFDTILNQAKQKAAISRDTRAREKEAELERERSKYQGKSLSNLQDFGSTKNETDINTRNTLESLISSLATMGLGGSRALSRQILGAANRSNRQANATQATNQRDLDTSFNEYKGGYNDDLQKINDQYNYDVGEANRSWGQNRQNTLYKMADVYNSANRSGDRERLMNEGNDLTSFINNAAFLNPSYTGASREMATPELSKYTQDIAQYNTTGIGGNNMVGSTTQPGNLAVRALAVNDKDIGVKKKTEGNLGYGV